MNLVVIAHNIRSTHNVGAIFRTCDGFGVNTLYLSGYTPHPTFDGDTRLPHTAEKLTRQIHKTALGAETTVPFEYHEDPTDLLQSLRDHGYELAALEQTPDSIMLPDFHDRPNKLALLLGEEVEGISPALLAMCDVALEIPMVGHKESFNVSVATGIALYGLVHASLPKSKK